MSARAFLGFVNGIKTRLEAIIASTGVSDANKIIATAADGRLDPSLLPTGIGPSTVTIQATEALVAGDFVNIHDSTGPRVRKADASNGRIAHGFVLSAVANAASGTVYLQGLNTALTGLTPGQLRFLGSAGASTSTAPSASGSVVQELGICISATALNFEHNDYIQL